MITFCGSVLRIRRRGVRIGRGSHPPQKPTRSDAGWDDLFFQNLVAVGSSMGPDVAASALGVVPVALDPHPIGDH